MLVYVYEIATNNVIVEATTLCAQFTYSYIDKKRMGEYVYALGRGIAEVRGCNK